MVSTAERHHRTLRRGAAYFGCSVLTPILEVSPIKEFLSKTRVSAPRSHEPVENEMNAVDREVPRTSCRECSFSSHGVEERDSGSYEEDETVATSIHACRSFKGVRRKAGNHCREAGKPRPRVSGGCESRDRASVFPLLRVTDPSSRFNGDENLSVSDSSGAGAAAAADRFNYQGTDVNRHRSRSSLGSNRLYSAPR